LTLRRIPERLARTAGEAVLLLVSGAAWLLSPWRLGRLLRTVSIPRLREHRLRTSLTTVGIALGIAVLIAVAVVNRSIMKSVATTIDDVAGKADLQVTAGASGFDGALVDTVRSVPGVARSAVVIEQTVAARDPRAKGERLLLLGVDFLNADDDYFRSYGSPELAAIEADPVVFLNSPHNIILSRAVADKLGYRLHDRIPLQTPLGKEDFEIWGFIQNEGVGRAFGGSIAVMDYGAMQVAFDRGTNVDRIDIAVLPGADVATVAKAVKAAVGPTFFVDRPERRNDRVSSMLASLRNGLTMASLVALVVGMFLIYNTMSISVVQRRREIGTLRALGATRRDIVVLFTLEGALLGLVGSVVGVVIGLGLAHVMLDGMQETVSEMFMPVPATRLHVSRAILYGIGSLGVLATTIAAAFPAMQAARSSPIEALRTGALVQMQPLPRHPLPRDAAAVALLAAAWLLLRVPPIHDLPLGATGSCLALVLSGALLSPRLVQLSHWIARGLLRRTASVEARIANENLPRNIVRTSMTISALMVGVAMATSFAAFVGSFESSTMDWVDQTLPADLWITSASRLAGGGASLPMSSELSGTLAALPGVDVVERVRMDDIDYRGFPVKLVATEIAAAGPRIRMVMLEGTQEEAFAKMKAGGVVIAENFSRRFGVHRGDRIALNAKNGPRSFDVCGVIIDYTSDTGMLMLDRATYVDGWGDDRVDTYKLYLKAGSDPEITRRAINSGFSDRYDLFVLTNREFRAEVVAMLDQAFQVMHVLEAVAIVISVLGVVNALLANVLDRIRELAVLRAVGMLRAQVAKMVVFEGGLVGVIGVLGGIVLGLAIGHVLLRYINVTQTGWYLPYRPSWAAVAETALLVGAGSALSGWYPARHAARLVIADALDYE
jgi:putative ABC transport system permease protein